MNARPRVLTIIPTYNEAENIAPLVESLRALDLGLSILIVDDNSPDGTGVIADCLMRAHPTVHVIHRPAKLGLGTAYTTGFLFALEHGFDRVVTMDADFSHNPRYLPSLIKLTDEADVAVGSRYVPGGGVRLWGFNRRLLSRGANLFARWLLDLKVNDCTAGFRCYRREVLQAVHPTSIQADGYSYLIEMLWRVLQAGFTVVETPIVFTDRRRGASKISRQEIIKAGATVLRLAFRATNGTMPPAHLPDPEHPL